MNIDKEYGYEKCPLDEGKSCFDYDRYGTLACGLCGADKELQKEGVKNLSNAINESKRH